MPRKPKSEKPSAEILAPIPADILDQIVRDGPLTAAEVETATRRFKKALIERALGAELTHHLGYAPGAPKPELTTNHRNGTSGKTVLTDDGPVPIEVPRDRDGTLRAAADWQTRAALHRLRRQGHRAVRARLDGARDSSVPQRDVRRRGLAGSDQHGHRCGRGGSDRLAKPPARAAVSSRLLRCVAREDSRRSGGAQQSGLSGAGGPARWHRATFSGSGSSRPKAPNSG